MKNWQIILFSFLMGTILPGSGCSQTAPGQVKSKSDLELMQGKWVRVFADTQSLEKDTIKEELEIKGKKLTLGPATVSIELNEKVSPKRMDMITEIGKIKAIYKMDGDKLWIYFYPLARDERPTSFNSTPSYNNNPELQDKQKVPFTRRR